MDPNELAAYLCSKIGQSIEKLVPIRTGIITDVHQDFCNVAIKLSFALRTETDEYTVSFNAYSIISIVNKINGGDAKVSTPPKSILKELETWQSVLQGAWDIIAEGTGVSASFYPVNLNQEKGLQMVRYELQVDDYLHEFIFSYTSKPHTAVTLEDLDALYSTFEIPEKIHFNLGRPILTQEEIDSLGDHTHNENDQDLFTQAETEALLAPADEDEAVFIEDKRTQISRMLYYVMIAKDEGLLPLISEIEQEPDFFLRTLFGIALEGEEFTLLLQMANKEIASVSITSTQSRAAYEDNIKIALVTIQCLYGAKGLKEASQALESFLD